MTAPDRRPSLPTFSIGNSPPSYRTRGGSRTSHIYLDGRGLALCCGGDRPLLAKSCRLVDESRDDRPTRHRCPRDGDLAAWKTRRSAASFRPGQPIYEQAVPAADGRSWRRLFNESVRQRLGQRCDGELLLLAQNREDRQKGVSASATRRGPTSSTTSSDSLQPRIRTPICLCH